MVFLISFLESILTLISRIIMKTLINWWRNKYLKHIEATIIIENIEAKAKMDGRIPYILICLDVTNNSESDMNLKNTRIEMVLGDWNLGHSVIENGVLLKKKMTVNKIESSHIEVRIAPPFEFWLLDSYACTLNGRIEMEGFYGTVIKHVDKHNTPVDVDQVTIGSYRNQLKSRIKSLVNS